MFFEYNYFYYLTIGLQVICAIHCIKNGNQSKWIWLIIFLPIIGCIAYIYTEMGSSKNLIKSKLDVGAIINPGGRIKKLEDNVRFTDTFANKIKLADAYLASGNTEKAIAIYEASLKGTFADNEHALSQLSMAYFEQQRYEDAIETAQKICKSQRFIRSRAHILYALALENSGKAEQSEKEFKAMKGRYSCFEHRYQYSQFLKRAGREADACSILQEMLDEVPHLSSVEKKAGRTWFIKSKEDLRTMES